jgi:hypothetical protein
VTGDREPGEPLHRWHRLLDDAPRHAGDGTAALATNVLVVVGGALETRAGRPELDPPQRPVGDQRLDRAIERGEIGGQLACRELVADLLDRPIVPGAAVDQLCDRVADVGRPRDGGEDSGYASRLRNVGLASIAGR